MPYPDGVHGGDLSGRTTVPIDYYASLFFHSSFVVVHNGSLLWVSHL